MWKSLNFRYLATQRCDTTTRFLWVVLNFKNDFCYHFAPPVQIFYTYFMLTMMMKMPDRHRKLELYCRKTHCFLLLLFTIIIITSHAAEWCDVMGSYLFYSHVLFVTLAQTTLPWFVTCILCMKLLTSHLILLLLEIKHPVKFTSFVSWVHYDTTMRLSKKGQVDSLPF